jgi:hypothetical protein
MFDPFRTLIGAPDGLEILRSLETAAKLFAGGTSRGQGALGREDIRRGFILFGATLLFAVCLPALGLALWLRGWPGVRFVGSTFLLIAALTAVPIALRSRPLLELALTLLVVLAFPVWIFGVAEPGIWMAYAAGGIVVIYTGGWLVKSFRGSTLARIAANEAFRSLNAEAAQIERVFRGSQLVYASFPIGLLIGAMAFTFGKAPAREALAFGVQAVLALALVALAAFLAWSAARMLDPMIASEPILKPLLAADLPKAAGKDDDPPDVLKQDFNLAVMVSDVRRVYLLDSLHNYTLAACAGLLILQLLRIGVSMPWTFLTILGLAFLLIQLPYGLGQSRMRSGILNKVDGTLRVDAAKKLEEYAPLYYKADWITLLLSGTVGSLALKLIEKSVEGLFPK